MTIDIHVDSADQHPDVPKPKDREQCKNPLCNPSVDWCPGYGMAGGGMGVYTYCNRCDKVIDKVQDADLEDKSE